MITKYHNIDISPNNVDKEIHVDRVITIFYRELSSTYRYSGESHDFWELVYVDSGEIDVVADEKGYGLSQGDIIFHKPNEFHAFSAALETSPSIIVISFASKSKALTFFENLIFNVPINKRYLIVDIIKEAKGVYNDELGNIYLENNRRENIKFGSEQLLYSNLEKALIEFYRMNLPSIDKDKISIGSKNKIEFEMVNSIIEYMKENLDKNLKIDDICNNFYISRTRLKVIFKRNCDSSVISYYNKLKIEEAKRLIRLGTYTFTEVSKILGFESIHYFSSFFKKHCNMSPTEYYASVKAMEENI